MDILLEDDALRFGKGARLNRLLTSSAKLRTPTFANTISIHMAAAGAVSPASSILITATEASGLSLVYRNITADTVAMELTK